MKFDTRVYHPNISSQTGAICLDILYVFDLQMHDQTLTAGNNRKDNWTPVLTLKTALISLQSLLFDAVPNDPQDAEVARVYISSRATFDATAREWTRKYANKEGVIVLDDDEAGLDKSAIARLMEMGFERPKVVKALRKFTGDEHKSVEFLLSGEI
jgi:ubiquitin-conjugating enzyme (huntingtin interacting protein 2)